MPTTAPNALKPGTKAPAFALPDQHGTIIRSADFKGRPLVVYFYPKDDTDDCTTQACDFTRRFPAFEKLDAAVVGISRLDQKSKARFARKHDIRIPLLADESTKVSDAFGVLVEKSMYGKKYMGIVRTTFLIDAAGKVAARWDVTDVAGHAEVVLAAVKAFAAGESITMPAAVAVKPKSTKPTPRKKAARSAK